MTSFSFNYGVTKLVKDKLSLTSRLAFYSMGAGRSKLILDLILEAEWSTSLSANTDKPSEINGEHHIPAHQASTLSPTFYADCVNLEGARL